MIPPGGRGKLQVTFHTEGLEPQYYDLYIDVYHNDPRERDNGPFVSRLNLSGRVELFFELQPLGGNYLGLFSFSRPPKRRFRLVAKDKQPFQILKVEYPKGKLKLQWLTQGKKKQHEFLVKVKEKQLPGEWVAPLRIDTDHPRQKVFFFKLWGKVLGALECTPDYLIFGPVKRNQGLDRRRKTVTLMAREGPPFRILSAEVDRKRFRLEVNELVVGKRWEVTLTLRQDAPGGPFGCTLKIWTNHPQSPYFAIPVLGSLEPEVRWFPSALLLRKGQGRVKIFGPKNLHLQLSRGPQGAKVLLKPKGEGQWELVLKGETLEEGVLVLKTNVLGEEKISIPYRREKP